MAGIAGGADVVVVPEAEIDPETVADELEDAYKRGKAHALVVVAEGAKYNAAGLTKHFETSRARPGFDLRATILGHVQRGGTPGAFDRLLATRLAVGAVEHLARGEHGCLIGLQRGEVRSTPLEQIVGAKKPLDHNLLEIQKVLAK
jgi:6-phosphofructokinase 1